MRSLQISWDFNKYLTLQAIIQRGRIMRRNRFSILFLVLTTVCILFIMGIGNSSYATTTYKITIHNDSSYSDDCYIMNDQGHICWSGTVETKNLLKINIFCEGNYFSVCCGGCCVFRAYPSLGETLHWDGQGFDGH